MSKYIGSVRQICLSRKSKEITKILNSKARETEASHPIIKCIEEESLAVIHCPWAVLKALIISLSICTTLKDNHCPSGSIVIIRSSFPTCRKIYRMSRHHLNRPKMAFNKILNISQWTKRWPMVFPIPLARVAQFYYHNMFFLKFSKVKSPLVQSSWQKMLLSRGLTPPDGLPRKGYIDE